MDHSLAQIIQHLQAGDESAFEHIREQYAALLFSMVSGAMSKEADAEFEDLMQEATLALYHAALKFDLSQDQVTFGLFAKICIHNRLVSALRKQHRQSRTPAEPKQILTPSQRKSVRRAQMEVGELSDLVDTLFSDFEKSVYRLYIAGYSASEIANQLGRTDKSIDNAIYRVRRKIKQYYL